MRFPREAMLMTEYRLYCLDGAGKIDLADWFEAANDCAALSEAQRLKPNAARCEIWQRNRLVAKLNGMGRFEMC